MPLHVPSTCAHHQEIKIALHCFWYHHTETSESSKITKIQFYKYEQIVVYIRGVTGGTDQTSGGCSLCYTIPIQPKTPISKVGQFGR